MSTPVARPAVRERAYAKITTPVFHMTGAHDDSPIGKTMAGERRIPFDKMTAAETYLSFSKTGITSSFRAAPDWPKIAKTGRGFPGNHLRWEHGVLGRVAAE